jgi:Flp pilus assembly protein TadG
VTVRTSWEREEGAAAVEFALIVVLLMILVFGIIEFGVAYSKVNVYTGAAREGARYAAVRCTPDVQTGCTNALIQSKVESSAANYPIPAGSVTANIVCSNSTIGQTVVVSWNQPISVNIPFIPGLNPATFTRQVEAAFRCE